MVVGTGIASGSFGDGVAGVLDIVDIVTVAACHGVVARAAIEYVGDIAGTTGERIVPGTADKEVTVCAAVYGVVAVKAQNQLLACGSGRAVKGSVVAGSAEVQPRSLYR